MDRYFELYTDGSFNDKYRVGGWAFILRCPYKKKKEIVRSGFFKCGSVTYAELQAIEYGLSEIVKRIQASKNVKLYTDMSTVKKAVNNGMLKHWENNGWQGSNGKIKYRGIWKHIAELIRHNRLTIHCPKGHRHAEYLLCHRMSQDACRLYVDCLLSGHVGKATYMVVDATNDLIPDKLFRQHSSDIVLYSTKMKHKAKEKLEYYKTINKDKKYKIIKVFWRYIED